MSDDWLCLDTLPIIEIIWWGSYLEWQEAAPPYYAPEAFHIQIKSDTGGGYPGELIRSFRVLKDEIEETHCGCDFHPDHGMESCFKYRFVIPEKDWFYQKGLRNVYWISISAQYSDIPKEHLWGWKTREHHYNNPASQGIRAIVPVHPADDYFYIPLQDSSNVPWDMAFELLTIKDVPTPTPTPTATPTSSPTPSPSSSPSPSPTPTPTPPPCISLEFCPEFIELWKDDFTKSDLNVLMPCGPSSLTLSVKSPPEINLAIDRTTASTSCTTRLTITPLSPAFETPYEIFAFADDGKNLYQASMDVVVIDGFTTEPEQASFEKKRVLDYLEANHPELGLSAALPFKGYDPNPRIFIVDYYNYEWESWELRLNWHVMIPPHDWTNAAIVNYKTGYVWYVHIDTNGVFHEYSPEAYSLLDCRPIKPEYPWRLLMLY